MTSMSSFRQAREVVQQKLGKTLADGYEDDKDYNVLLADPATDDQVNLVSKSTGKLHRELFFAEEARLNAMTPVRDD